MGAFRRFRFGVDAQQRFRTRRPDQQPAAFDVVLETIERIHPQHRGACDRFRPGTLPETLQDTFLVRIGSAEINAAIGLRAELVV